MAGAQHVPAICLTYCLLSKGLWHSGVWTGPRSAGRVQSSRRLCAQTTAPGLRPRSPSRAAGMSSAAEHRLVGRSTGVVEAPQPSPPSRTWAGMAVTGLGCRNPRPQSLPPSRPVSSNEFCSVMRLNLQVSRSAASSRSLLVSSNG